MPTGLEGDYLPDRPRRYRAGSARAQEAHEAIRPAGERFRHPDDLGPDVDADGRRLYRLIWQRTLASQMNDAQFEQTRLQVAADAGADGTAVFQANGQVVVFDGFLRIYAGDRPGDSLLPDVAEGMTGSRSMPSIPAGAKPAHPTAGPKPALSANSSDWASVALPPTRRSWKPSRASTWSARKAPSCRAGTPSR